VRLLDIFSNVRLGRPLAMLLIAGALAGCAAQRYNERGQRQIEDGHIEQGLQNLHRASLLEPDNLRYRLDYMDHLNDENKKLIQRGEALRISGEFDEARDYFLTALKFDPSNERARRGIADVERDVRHAAILSEAETLFAAGKLDAARERLKMVELSDPSNKRGRELMRKIDDELDKQRRAKEAVIISQSILKKPVTLQFRDANLRMVFEALSRTTGLNVIFDRDVRADLKTTIFVRDGSIEDTVDLILLQSQLEKKTLNANTMFIYPATPTKQKEYQELKVRTFQISNGDPKYIQSMLKTVLKIKEIQVDEHSGTLVLRDTPEALAVAARVIAAHDLAAAEVMLEVEVLEISRDKLSNLGIVWPDNFSLSTPTDAAGGALTFGALKNLTGNQLLTTPLQATLNMKLQNTDANLLASPRIRVRDNEKAKILIGDKVPIITNTVTPLSTGSPVVTGSVQYIDVGIKLEALPHTYPEGDVSILLNLEVSNIVKEIVGPAGSLAYQIGTRMVSTTLRLHDGQTQILGGLISDSDRNTASKIPGIGQLPILGRLFSNNNGDRTKTEIVLSITPRILRARAVAEDSMADVWSGTEGTIRENPLRLDPISSAGGASVNATLSAGNHAEPVAAPAVLAAPAVPATLAAPAPAAPTSATAPTVKSPASKPAADETSSNAADGSNTTDVPQIVVASAVVPAATGTPGAAPAITWSSPGSVKTGDRFSITVSGANFDNIHSLPIAIQYDAAVLTFVEATLGEFSTRAGASPVAPLANQQPGRANLLLTANKATSFAGSGELLNLVFVAKLPRRQTQLMLARVDTSDGHTPLTIPRPPPLTLGVNP
jgi:general secretion pathway protein D